MADTPTGSRGRSLHGRAAEVHLAKAERERRLAAEVEGYKALGRLVGALASRVTGLPGPDALRAIAPDRETALAAIAAAFSPQRAAAVEANWEASEPDAPRQVSRPVGEDWGPLHDPRVMAAMGRPEEQQVIREVTAEYAQRAAERQARREQVSDVLWELRDGSVLHGKQPGTPPGVNVDAAGYPKQTTMRVNTAVPELGSESPGWDYLAARDALEDAMLRTQIAAPAAPRQAAPEKAPAAGCRHTGQEGRFCTQCGSPLLEEVAVP